MNDAQTFIKKILRAKNDSRFPEFWKNQLDLIEKKDSKLYVLNDQDTQVTMIKAEFARTLPN